MNNYIGIYFLIHIGILLLLLINVLTQYRRKKLLSFYSYKDENWVSQLSRTNMFLRRSIYNLLFALIGEIISTWLLYMGGLFDK